MICCKNIGPSHLGHVPIPAPPSQPKRRLKALWARILAVTFRPSKVFRSESTTLASNLAKRCPAARSFSLKVVMASSLVSPSTLESFSSVFSFFSFSSFSSFTSSLPEQNKGRNHPKLSFHLPSLRGISPFRVFKVFYIGGILGVPLWGIMDPPPRSKPAPKARGTGQRSPTVSGPLVDLEFRSMSALRLPGLAGHKSVVSVISLSKFLR